MDSYRESDLIRTLKIQLTTVNGYARMLEREIAATEGPTPRQREYMNRLVQSIDKLQHTAQIYEDRSASSESQSSSAPCGTIGSKG